MTNPRMTIEELKTLLAMDEYKDGVKLVCDDGQYHTEMATIRVVYVHRDQFAFIDGDDDVLGDNGDCLKHYSSILNAKKKVTKYWRWRLYFKNGNMQECNFLLDKEGRYGCGDFSRVWEKAIKREKIGEAITKVKGQEGYIQ